MKVGQAVARALFRAPACSLCGFTVWARPVPQGERPESPLETRLDGGYVENWNSGWALYFDNARWASEIGTLLVAAP